MSAPCPVRLSKDIDLEKNRAIRNDPRVYLTCRQSNLISLTAQLNWKEGVESDPTIEMYGLEAEDEDQTGLIKDYNSVGTCGLTSISKDHGTAEYSMLIFPEYQGKGYGKAGLEALLDFGFKNWSWLHLVWGEIYDFNKAGVKIATDLGFKKEANLRQRYFKEGARVDTCIVSITRDEYLT
jgi:RimJ/RimL family protein N-acetyltransferase